LHSTKSDSSDAIKKETVIDVLITIYLQLFAPYLQSFAPYLQSFSFLLESRDNDYKSFVLIANKVQLLVYSISIHMMDKLGANIPQIDVK